MPQDVDFFLPISPQVNPLERTAKSHSLRWAQRFSLATSDQASQRILAYDMAGLMSRWFPYAAGPDLNLSIDAMVVAVLFDDHFESTKRVLSSTEARHLSERFINIMQFPEVSAQGTLILEAAFADVWSRLTEGMSQEWRRRTARNWADFFEANVSEVENRSRQEIMNVPDYLMFRRRSGFVQPMIDMTERIYHFELPPDIHEMPQIQALRDVAADVIDAVNDMHSLEKEEADKDPHNLVTVIRENQQCTRDDAIIIARDMTNLWVRKFLTLSAQLSEVNSKSGIDQRISSDINRWAAAMKDAIRGNHDWGASTARYSGASFEHSKQEIDREDLMVPIKP
ncbi:hypothetical protein ACFV2D_35745 [Streptomyces capillispiralis]|uniref:terpene synthase family protein n=1 Tax=Streptomyces capillispiralis TaxID=68182 RepID=UPI00367A601F